MRLILLFFLFISLSAYSDIKYDYKFRILLRDKGESGFTVDRPEEFLSAKAIERRRRQNIVINEQDLPIAFSYLSKIEELGCKVVAKSKWVNTVTIHCEDSTIVAEIRKLDFVEKAECVSVWDNIIPARSSVKSTTSGANSILSSSYYGYGQAQMDLVNGRYLHEQGYEGQGIEIAVIDAGFWGLDENPLSPNMEISGYKNFVYTEDEDSFHGFQVLSLMAANKPDTYVGSAPASKYWLFKTEQNWDETPVEEDYWVAAAEYADSVGVDIITTSLGYTWFNEPFVSHTWDDLDGNTVLMSRAAEIATQKGIFVVNGAGNSGHTDWKKIAIPADAEHVLTVGSVNQNSQVSDFSSIGPSADGRIKPDIVGLGESINFVAEDGSVYTDKGTSFSTPIISGLVACLWQAYPDLTNYELLDVVRKSAHRYKNPDNLYGYGIPDMKKAFELAKDPTSGIPNEIDGESSFDVELSSDGKIYIKNNKDGKSYMILVMTLDGKVIMHDRLITAEQSFTVPDAIGKVFVLNIRGNGVNDSRKIKF